MKRLVFAVFSLALASPLGGLDTARIERLTGLKGKLDEKEGVFKVSYPRADLQARVAGVRVTPPMGLTAGAAFSRAGDHAMVMGDIVLLDDRRAVDPALHWANALLNRSAITSSSF